MSLVNLAGAIHIDVTHQAGKISAIGIRSSRPQQIGKMLIGRSAGEVAAVLPALFSLCSDAHRVASIRAFELAQVASADHQTEALRTLLVDIEAARERLLRVISLTGVGISPAEVMRWQQTARQHVWHAIEHGKALTSEQKEQIFNDYTDLVIPLSLEIKSCQCPWESSGVVGKFIATTVKQFAEVTLGDAPHPLLQLDDELLNSLLINDNFTLAPEIAHQCREAGVWPQMCNSSSVAALQAQGVHPLVLRVMALLHAAIDWPTHNNQIGHQFVEGAAIGLAHASRGLLLHHLVQDEGQVVQYRVVSPTEWNFHPHGVVSQLLSGVVVAADKVQALVELVVACVDPCVHSEIEINYA
ncbi:nickel-dependent hydrogenase large subunit [Neptunomonas marina]|uniref:Ni,Fe-hydrogenase I large subunit n=1 Tax=Neptunomonas marina TaxID=1815562 RepID=A0A437QEJ3_9GAMM|nr:nickel-dependent hydrogenase large subunit [Neptunomonas marina]RVU32940.1 hypothetical protein EOE65_04615 [Neptunomonas marina]